MRYRTEIINTDGGDGWSRVIGGISVPVASPLGEGIDPSASNPEQLLALAWATCLNATAQVLVNGEKRTAVRVEVALEDAEPGPGYLFRVDGYLSLEGASLAETEELLLAAEARCPVSNLLHGASTVGAHAEPYDVLRAEPASENHRPR